ncbi:MAG TPA: phosphoribosyltransferase [Caldilineaceae bacterium]|nr:phosphoribosyltransferase [Caldilineaceae bacterium]
MDRFRNRAEAGQRLAERLAAYRASETPVCVLGLARGGVPVAFEIAMALHAPLDVFIVRKLGVPGYEELAMGAIASGGVQVLNADVISGLRIPDYIIASVTAREQQELNRRERAYRGDRPPPAVQGRVVILVDDGIATGATMRAAIRALRAQEPARIVVAVPVALPEECEALREEVDEVVCLLQPHWVGGIGLWYEDFRPVTDQQVRDLLARAATSGKQSPPATRRLPSTP